MTLITARLQIECLHKRPCGVPCFLDAEYFVTNAYHPSHWSYFDFGVPCYTNFSSPIRRFADVLCHHALATVLAQDAVCPAASAASRSRAVELGITACPLPGVAATSPLVIKAIARVIAITILLIYEGGSVLAVLWYV